MVSCLSGGFRRCGCRRRYPFSRTSWLGGGNLSASLLMPNKQLQPIAAMNAAPAELRRYVSLKNA